MSHSLSITVWNGLVYELKGVWLKPKWVGSLTAINREGSARRLDLDPDAQGEGRLLFNIPEELKSRGPYSFRLGIGSALFDLQASDRDDDPLCFDFSTNRPGCETLITKGREAAPSKPPEAKEGETKAGAQQQPEVQTRAKKGSRDVLTGAQTNHNGSAHAVDTGKKKERPPNSN